MTTTKRRKRRKDYRNISLFVLEWIVWAFPIPSDEKKNGSKSGNAYPYPRHHDKAIVIRNDIYGYVAGQITIQCRTVSLVDGTIASIFRFGTRIFARPSLLQSYHFLGIHISEQAMVKQQDF